MLGHEGCTSGHHSTVDQTISKAVRVLYRSIHFMFTRDSMSNISENYWNVQLLCGTQGSDKSYHKTGKEIKYPQRGYVGYQNARCMKTRLRFGKAALPNPGHHHLLPRTTHPIHGRHDDWLPPRHTTDRSERSTTILCINVIVFHCSKKKKMCTLSDLLQSEIIWLHEQKSSLLLQEMRRKS